MAKLTEQEIIYYYKLGLSITEIQIKSNYFTSIYRIKKELENARKSGIITPEDDLKNQVEQERKKLEKKSKKGRR